jgi:Kef-type K+ transport system membrane component KefB
MENLVMNIEKRNAKMFNIIWMVVLAAILLTAVGGILVQRLGLPSLVGDMGISRGNNPTQPQSTQTSPTGELVMTTGIILLMVGFIVIVLMLLVRRNWSRRNPS